MKLKGIAMAAAMVVLPATISAQTGEQAKPTARQRMASVDYLIGTWSCAHKVGTYSGTYTTNYSKVLGDRWLKETWDFPGVTAEALMGYDEARQAWVRFFANSRGQHFEVRMTDVPDGWTFKYATFFARTRPETPEPDATFTKKSDTDYVIDGPTYPREGTLVTEHHACHKV